MGGWCIPFWRRAMVRRRTLDLTADAHEALVDCRDHDPHPQMRERAAALLKIAHGASPHAVAVGGLLRRRKPDTVYTWLDRYETAGLQGLREHLHQGHSRGRLRRRPDSAAAAVAARHRSEG